MTTPTDLRQAANIPKRLEKLLEQLDRWPSDVDEQGASLAERVAIVCDHVRTKHDLSEPNLIPTSSWKNAARVLDEIASAIEAFIASDAGSPTSEVESKLDEVIVEVSLWPGTLTSTDIVTKAAASYRRSLGRRLSPVKKEVSGLRTEVRSLQAEIERIDASANEKLGSFESEADKRLDDLSTKATSVSERTDDLAASITDEKKRLDGSLAQFQQQFLEAQQSRIDAFQEALQAANDMTSKERDRLIDTGKKVLEEMEKQLAQTKDFVGVIVTSGTTDAYSREAKDQRAQANIWRALTVFFALLAGGVVVWAVFAAVEANVGIILTITKIAAAIGLGGIAQYAGTQSGQHRRREVDARRIELQLASLGPFVADLPVPKQQEIREQLVHTMFNQPPSHGIDGKPAITEDSVSLLSKIRTLFYAGD